MIIAYRDESCRCLCAFFVRRCGGGQVAQVSARALSFEGISLLQQGGCAGFLVGSCASLAAWYRVVEGASAGPCSAGSESGGAAGRLFGEVTSAEVSLITDHKQGATVLSA